MTPGEQVDADATSRLALPPSRRRGNSLIESITALSIVQVANYIFPLLTLPVLARSLPAAEWRSFLYGQGMAYWIGQMIEFGFTLSATRLLADGSLSEREQERCVASTSGAQLLIAVIVSASVLAAASFFRIGPLGFVEAATVLAIGFGQGVSPGWYFQGVREHKTLAKVSVITRATWVAVVVATAPLWREAEPILATQAMVTLGSSFYLFRLVYRRLDRVRCTFAEIRGSIRSGFQLFVFRASSSLYTSFNVVLIGFISPVAVAPFAAADRLFRSAQGLIGTVGQASFPHMVKSIAGDREAGRTRARRLLAAMAGGAVLIAGIGIVAAPIAVTGIFGRVHQATTLPLQILLLVLPVAAASNVYGIQWMVPHGLDKQFNLIVGGAAVLNLVLLPMLTRAGGAAGAALCVLIVEAGVLVSMHLVLRKLRLNLIGRA